MEIQILDIINVLTTMVAGVAGWFVGKRKQKNDFLSELQSSVDLLATENKKLVSQVVAMNNEIIQLRKENAELRVEIGELNTRLENVKTITKKA
jgi:archaellum component FlaC